MRLRSDYTFFFNSTSPFSQWHPSMFIVNDRLFTSGEHYMMYCKAVLFGDWRDKERAFSLGHCGIAKRFSIGDVSRMEILNNPLMLDSWNHAQKMIKQFGRKIDNYDDEVWSNRRLAIVRSGALERFTQDKVLQDALLSTGSTILVEASPWDKVWGVGLREHDERILDESNWLGDNLLGKALTQVRDRLLNSNTVI